MFKKETLNPSLYDEKGNLIPEVGDRLLRIGFTFMREIEGDLDFDLVDIVLTGSNASYQWNEHSDMDVHLVVNYNDNDEFKAKLADLARQKWNTEHDVKVKGYDVEVYVEDYRTPATSDGIWSLINSVWIKKPSKPGNEENEDATYAIYNEWRNKIYTLKNNYESGALSDPEAMAEVIKMKKELKNMRQRSLDKEGTFGSGNLAFKLMRNTEVLDILTDIGKKAYDSSLTMEQLDESSEYKHSARYIGACVHVGSGSNYPICDYFSDATEMAQVVGDPDTGEKSGMSSDMIPKQFNSIEFKQVPAKVQKVINKARTNIGNEDVVQVEYVSSSRNRHYTFEESGLFWIYDVGSDIHYFFRK